MKDFRAPRLHLFVCVNRRPGSALGPGCGEYGDDLYTALKVQVGIRGETTKTWVTRTHCLGICPKQGATVARHPPLESRSSIMTEATTADVAELLTPPAAPKDVTAELMHELELLEELQRKKVLDLARRLKPGLTLEDVQNPHDFPELDDPDWHYADGVLAGIASVRTAALAQRRKGEE